MELTEGVGESSSPPRGAAAGAGGGAGGGGGFYDFRADIFSRLLASGHEVVANPEWREQLHAHLSRLPPSYGVDVYIERVEDVLVHQQLLADAKDPEKRPAFHVRFVENIWTKADGNGYMEQPTCCGSTHTTDSAHVRTSVSRNGDHEIDFEPCSKLEDLNLEVRKFADDYAEKRDTVGSFSGRKETVCNPVHEITFSTVDKPKLLSQLSALLSDIGLNIREAHVFSTADGYSLDVFVVDGWHVEETGSLHEAVRQAIGENEGSWAGSSPSHSASEKTLSAPLRRDDWEIDRRVLKLGPKIANGSCGELYHGTYQGLDVAVKILRTDQVNEAMEEFAQEITILREVQHENIVRFIGASTKRPELCIVTEYMPGGSLYDFLHKNHNILGLPLILRFALDICKGMEYLHKNNIIHRDLKTANLLMDTDNVVKVADFGVARFLHPGGIMTAETGTYRWMAPEVINHEPYDHKADVFSFAIVLWELLTGKVPYNNKTPLQAALGVRQGQRPDLPKNAHPKLLELMQRCWDENPSKRPTFTEITSELEDLQRGVEGGVEPLADGV